MDIKTKVWVIAMGIGAKYWGCHQLSERSFFWGSFQLPVCARCTGIILGELVGASMFFLIGYIPIWLLFVALLPMLIDGTLQYLFQIESTNTRRFITGLLFGIAFAFLFMMAIAVLIRSFRS